MTLVLAACTGGAPAGPDVMTAPMNAEQAAAEIDQVKSVTPLPNGAVWRAIKLDPEGQYGPYWGGSLIEFQALCAWFAEAQVARAEGDGDREEAARAVVRTIPTWRSFSDPVIMDAESQALIRSKVDAVLAGSFHEVLEFMVGNCT